MQLTLKKPVLSTGKTGVLMAQVVVFLLRFFCAVGEEGALRFDLSGFGTVASLSIKPDKSSVLVAPNSSLACNQCTKA